MTCPECNTALEGRFCHRCGWDIRLPAAGKAASDARRPRWQRLTMGAILAVCALVVLWLLLIPRQGTYAYLNPGQTAPDFALQTPDGKTVHLSDFKGQPVIVNFWASWCGPCRKEMPDLDQAYQKYKGDGLLVLAVNLSESKLTVQRYLEGTPVTFPVVMDERNQVEELFHIVPLPTTYFIDRNQKIQFKREGQMNFDYIEQQAKSLLGR